jgi:hypothetical protein
MAGGVGLVLSGAACASAAASQSLAGASRAFELKIMGVKWGNESWTPRPDGFDVGTTSASAALPRCSPAGSERLTTARECSGWSRPLLPDHAELAASEQAERDAARARRGGKPIRRVLSARFDKMSHRRRRPADSIVSPPPRQPIVDLMLLPRNASADQPPLAYIFSLPSLAKKEAPEVVADQALSPSLSLIIIWWRLGEIPSRTVAPFRVNSLMMSVNPNRFHMILLLTLGLCHKLATSVIVTSSSSWQ